MYSHIKVLPVVHPGSFYVSIIYDKTQWFDEMEVGIRANTEAANGACVLGDKGSNQNYIHERLVRQLYALIFPTLGFAPGFVINIIIVIEDRTACQRQADQ